MRSAPPGRDRTLPSADGNPRFGVARQRGRPSWPTCCRNAPYCTSHAGLAPPRLDATLCRSSSGVSLRGVASGNRTLPALAGLQPGQRLEAGTPGSDCTREAAWRSATVFPRMSLRFGRRPRRSDSPTCHRCHHPTPTDQAFTTTRCRPLSRLGPCGRRYNLPAQGNPNGRILSSRSPSQLMGFAASSKTCHEPDREDGAGVEGRERDCLARSSWMWMPNPTFPSTRRSPRSDHKAIPSLRDHHGRKRQMCVMPGRQGYSQPSARPIFCADPALLPQ